MKRFLTLMLAITLSATVSGAGIDYGSMSDADLHTMADKARAELYRRHVEKEAGDLILCDVDGAQVALTGAMQLGSGGYLRMSATIVNNTDRAFSVSVDNGYINGWETYCSLDAYQLAPGKKVRGELVFLLEDAGLTSLDEIEDFTLVFYLRDTDAHETLWESPEMQIFIDEEKVISVQEVYTID